VVPPTRCSMRFGGWRLQRGDDETYLGRVGKGPTIMEILMEDQDGRVGQWMGDTCQPRRHANEVDGGSSGEASVHRVEVRVENKLVFLFYVG
jgi:hypothetical protein